VGPQGQAGCGEKKLARLQQVKNKQRTNRMSPRFITKVILSQPSTCARAFAGAWRDLVGIGDFGCGRPTIGRIRDAFAGVCKSMCLLQTRSAGAAACKAAVALAAFLDEPLLCASVLHIHDEASLRLRSTSDALPGMRGRHRSSKVQQHAVSLHFQSQPGVRWLVELDPLSDKTAATLATSLQRVLRPLGETVGEVFASNGAMRQRPWLVHFLVGDGASTNEAAAKVLLAWVRRDPLPNDLRYFLIVIRCASHQSNLAVSSVVAGRAALVGATSSAPIDAKLGGFAGRSVCGAIARLFKFLVSDYEAEFAANLRDLIGSLRASRPLPALLAQQKAWQDLRELYGEGVLPEEALRILNGGFSELVHVVEDPASLAPGRLEEIRDSLF